MNAHWLIAPVLLPALAAALLVLLRLWPGVQRAVSVAAAIVLVLVAVRLLIDADSVEHAVYALGSWRPPFGIVLVLDRLSALMILLTSVLGLAVVIGVCAGEDRRGPFLHPLLHFELMGLSGAFLTGDLFNLFVFFEVLLIASYCLLLHGQTAGRLRVAVNYVIINLVGSSLFLIAAALLYGVAGTLNVADLAVALPGLHGAGRALAHSAALLLVVVFGLKAAMFPLFLWLAPTYVNAPAQVAALFAVMTKLGIYAIVRLQPLVLAPAAAGNAAELRLWLLLPALATMLWGASAALASKRLSGIAAQLTLLSIGTILALTALAKPAATGAALYYLAHSTIAGAFLFLVCGLVADQRAGAGDMLQRGPPLRHADLTGALFLLAGMAVAGLPPLSGFIGKATMLQASVGHESAPWIWTFVLGTSFLALLALSRGGMIVFWMSVPNAQVRTAGVAGPSVAAAAGLLLCLIALAVGADPVLRFTHATAVQAAHSEAYVRAVLSAGGRP